MKPETIFLANLPVIERIAAYVARRAGLGPDASAEFVQEVRLRFIDNDYAIIRKFEGRTALTTYLTVVIQRLFAQYRLSLWGKWRPSAEAERIGELAITLERLLDRDGYTFDEAAQMLTSRGDLRCTIEQLRGIYLRLPQPARPYAVPMAAEDHESETADYAARGDRRGQAAKIGQILDAVASGLTAEDRLILRMRFIDAKKVPDIARRLRLDQKKLYKRVDKLLSLFRRALEEQAIDSTDLDAILSAGDVHDELTVPNLRTIKTADEPGIYVDPGTARRTLQELLREREASGRK